MLVRLFCSVAIAGLIFVSVCIIALIPMWIVMAIAELRSDQSWVGAFGLFPATIASVIAFRAGWSAFGPAPRPGRCKSCDYNLRGNISGICPECGAPDVPDN